LHRLRHQRPPLLRAAHARRRLRHLRARSLDRRARRRDRPVRRPAPAQSLAPAESRRHKHHRHHARVDRPRRRPQALRQAARRTRHTASPRSHGHLSRRRRRSRHGIAKGATGAHAPHVGTAALARPSGAELRSHAADAHGKVYVLEVNPRASRTVPYVSKATRVPLAKIAARLMTGRKLREFLPEYIERGEDLDTGRNFFVKSPVFPWSKFPGVDTVLGPEMRSTGEVMGVADNFGEAFAKAQLAAGQKLPTQGTVFISVTDHDKPGVVEVARRFVDMGFKLVATHGTADKLEEAGLIVDRVSKVKEGRPNPVDLIKADRI